MIKHTSRHGTGKVPLLVVPRQRPIDDSIMSRMYNIGTLGFVGLFSVITGMAMMALCYLLITIAKLIVHSSRIFLQARISEVSRSTIVRRSVCGRGFSLETFIKPDNARDNATKSISVPEQQTGKTGISTSTSPDNSETKSATKISNQDMKAG